MGLVSKFSGRDDFINTARELGTKAAEELAAERKQLDEEYAKLDKGLKEKENTFKAICEKVIGQLQ